MRPAQGVRDWFARQVGARRYRRALTVAALRCIAHGWPVIPGAWWSPSAQRHMCDIPGCLSAGMHPADVEQNIVAPLIAPANLADYALTRRKEVVSKWSRHGYAVLVPTGISCDAIEVPHYRVKKLLEGQHDWGPIAHVGNSAYIFVTPTTSLTDSEIAELAATQILVHSRGSWVAIPPSIIDGLETTWTVPPGSVDWKLPAASALLPLIATA